MRHGFPEAPCRDHSRSLWKGAISFGLVTVPVGLYPATESRGELRFRLLHEKDGSPIDDRRFCEREDVEVEWKEIVKGYELSKGEYVVLTDADFEKARTPATQLFEIRDFVPADAVGDVSFDHPYYAAPSGWWSASRPTGSPASTGTRTARCCSTSSRGRRAARRSSRPSGRGRRGWWTW